MERIWIIIAAVAALAAFAVVLLDRLLRARRQHEEAAQLAQQEKRLDALAAQTDRLEHALAHGFSDSRNEMAQRQREQREEISRELKQMTDTLTKSLGEIGNANADHAARQNKMISESIIRMQESNEKKLDAMRETVDEKLTATLNQRLDSSFKTVSAQLESVNKSLGEMRQISSGVTDSVSNLNRVLTNVKARGTWAEVQLDGLLEQTIPNMYDRNVATGEDPNKRVEFAVRIPASDGSGNITYLPIDSKFPMEDYVRLCDAADRGDAEALEKARVELERRVRSEADQVKKYINVPKTTPFAILYLATEGLYSEITASRSGLPERLIDENIMLAGPMTITALLNSLSIGFKAVTINEKANEIREMLAAVKKQYDKFGGLLEKARKKIDEAGRTIDEATHRNTLIHKRLRSAEEMEREQADEILGITPGALEEDIEQEDV